MKQKTDDTVTLDGDKEYRINEKCWPGILSRGHRFLPGAVVHIIGDVNVNDSREWLWVTNNEINQIVHRTQLDNHVREIYNHSEYLDENYEAEN